MHDARRYPARFGAHRLGGPQLEQFMRSHRTRSETMNLVVWLPAMFGLGLVTMILCYVFIGACEKI